MRNYECIGGPLDGTRISSDVAKMHRIDGEYKDGNWGKEIVWIWYPR